MVGYYYFMLVRFAASEVTYYPHRVREMYMDNIVRGVRKKSIHMGRERSRSEIEDLSTSRDRHTFNYFLYGIRSRMADNNF
jgi:hypothetical protein